MPVQTGQIETFLSSSLLPNGIPLGSMRSATPTAKEAVQMFEGYVLKLMLREMQRTVPSGGLFSGTGGGAYQAILQDAMANRAAEAGTFGLAQQLLDSWGEKP